MTLTDIYTDIENLGNLEGVDITTIGESVLKNPILAVHIGSYEGDQIIVEGAIHAREYITSLVLVEMVKHLYDKDLDYGIYFVPLVNPDGVGLVLEGSDKLPQDVKDFVTNVNGGSQDFSMWKANINAVDLNVNFDALWGGGTQNVTQPAPANFIGYEPNSEPEVKALIDFTQEVNPVLTLSYHTKGEVIYYGFEVLTEQELARDLAIANAISLENGYIPTLTSTSTYKSTGGYSDWVSLNLRVPAYTVEVGNSSIPHPIGLEYLPSIVELNKNVPVVAYDALMILNDNNSRQQ